MAQASMTREACATLCYPLNFSPQAPWSTATNVFAAPKLNSPAQFRRLPPTATSRARERPPRATKELPVCNSSLSICARLDDLIGRLSLQEKAGLIGPDPVTSPCAVVDYGVKRLDIPPCLHLAEMNTAVGSACIISQDKCATTFIEAHRSWRSLQPLLAISTEMRTFNNLNWHRGGGVLQKIGLTDPFLSGEYAAAYVAGCQDGPDKKYKKMAAGLRHVDAHSVETNRMAFNGNISTFDLWDTEVCMSRALAAMCSYASINGVPSCANSILLNDVVRGQWKPVAKTLNGGADMELWETCFTTNGNLEQTVKHNRTTIDTVHNNTVRRVLKDSFITSQWHRGVHHLYTLTSSNGPCISEYPDGEYELGNGRALPHCPLNYYAKDHGCVPCTTCGMGTWASTPMLRVLRRRLLSLDGVQAGPEEVCLWQRLPAAAGPHFVLPTSMCEEPFIETIPPTLTTDRMCSCDTLACNKLITQLFEEMVCAWPTDEQLDVVLDVCCSGPGEDGIHATIRQMDAYAARRSCPGCTDTCECSAGFILVYDADSADCRPCDGVTEFSPSVGGSKYEPIEECELGQEEVAAPTRSSDRVCHDCSARTIDLDSDGSTASPAAQAPTTTTATLPPTPFHDVTECAPGFEEVQAMTLLISDRVCDECPGGHVQGCLWPGRARFPITTCDAGEEETAKPTPYQRPACAASASLAPPSSPSTARPSHAAPSRSAHDRLCRKCVQDTCVPVSSYAAWGYISTLDREQVQVLHLPEARRLRSTLTASARQEVVGALVAHIGTGQAQEVDAAIPPEAAAPVRVLMLNGILDCLSNLHFIHIWQLFRVLTTLTFDRQRIPAAGLIDHEKEDGLSQSNDELKRIGTIAATTITHTWLALANDAGISIDASMLRCHNVSTSTPSHLSVCRGVVSSPHRQLQQLPRASTSVGMRRSPTPTYPCVGRRDPQAHVPARQHRQHDCGLRGRTGVPHTRETCSNFSPEYTRAREVDKDTHMVVSEKTLQAPFETKLQLLAGIAAEFSGMMRSQTDEETRLREHAAGTRTSSCS
ncbi:hypothetical protein PTSG_06114 [Salpingoeca rosetta]|uniref:Uncharacterized protein n=1 Tax=Salpingoeca rosetta (strain ATCC 50818 / BSB-021) TaxID=946362 RepID=F2UDQ4_SALR5|nr:uncharacterized protein PTSG_06114 [Salpingoeca rosetta]EGD74749.1 hypothetical protein PTSG_06114 [Salpingoeca rosetta]|eukprot:XP_004993006.1 hypothetical protein PTSG_06114 [Salpingoeca rosetta]